MITKDSIAENLLSKLPESISSRIHRDRPFLKRNGLGSGLSLTGVPVLPVKWYVHAVRNLFNNRTPVSLSWQDGQKLTLFLEGTSIFAEHVDAAQAKTRMEPHVLKLLAPDPAMRILGLEKLAEEIGSTHPGTEYWRQRLDKGPLDVEEFSCYLSESYSSLPATLSVMEEQIPHMDRASHLIPKRKAYFENLCGRCSEESTMDWDVFKRTILADHRRRLALHPQLNQSLEVLLPMSIDEDLSPSILLAEIDDGTLWNALETHGYRDDPFGLIGQLDLCLARSEKDERFAGMAETVFLKLIDWDSETSPIHETLALFSGLASMIDQEMPLVPELAGKPFFWRRVCGWTHAGILTQMLVSKKMNVSHFLKWLKGGLNPLGGLARLLDLREAPRMNVLLNDKLVLRWELESRVRIILQRYPHMKDIDPYRTRITKWENPENIHPFMFLPGPLEEFERYFPLHGDDDSSTQWVLQIFEQEGTELWKQVWRLIWFHGVHRKLPDSFLEQLAGMLDGLSLGEGKEQRQQGLNGLDSLCLVAVQQGSEALANAIFLRFRKEELRKIADEEAVQLMYAGCVLIAAYQDASQGIEKLSTFFTWIAQNLPKGNAMNRLKQILDQMKRLLPVSSWRFQLPEALVKMASAP